MSTLALKGGKPVRGKPWPSWPEYGVEEKKALERVLKSESWGGYPAPNTEARRFGAEFARYQGSKYCVLAANGTFTLKVALQAGGVQPGDEVIVPPLTFVATAAAVIDAGAVPVFADIRADTWCLDHTLIEAAITKNTAAIIPVHLGGAMADMDAIMDIAARRKLLVVEDCAHAHGMQWREGKVGPALGAGCIGDFGSFSFQSSKSITAGEGGALTMKDRAHFERAQSLINCGRKEPGYQSYRGRLLGHNMRLSEWPAAILSCQLKRFPEQLRRKQKLMHKLRKRADEMPGLSPLPIDERIARWAAYQLLFRYDEAAYDGLPRDRFVQALEAEGVPVHGDFYASLPTHELFAMDRTTNTLVTTHPFYDPKRFSTPVSDHAGKHETLWFSHTLFLGVERDLDDIVRAVQKIHEHRAELRKKRPAAVNAQVKRVHRPPRAQKRR